MPRSTQIIPKYSFAHTETYINDYTQVTDSLSSSSGTTSMLFVFQSPKGEDKKMITIDGGLSEFVKKFGMGPSSIYGQPLMNAYACASTGNATLQCMRITAPDATHSNLAIFAKYKIVEEDTIISSGTSEDGSVGEVEIDPFNTTKVMYVKFFSKTYDSLLSLETIESLVDSDAELNVGTTDDDGFKTVHLFTFACKGKGSYGSTFGIKFQNIPSLNKENDYQNYYIEVYDSTDMDDPERFNVVLYDEAQIAESSAYIDDIVNDPDTGSEVLTMYTNMDGLNELFNTYKETVPDTDLTIESFDPILGAHKTTKSAIPNYKILVVNDETDKVKDNLITLNSTYGVYLGGGSDGMFDLSNITQDVIDKYNADNKTSLTTAEKVKKHLLESTYKKAFNGSIDPNIKSKTKFPVNIILDANYPTSVKQIITTLAIQRTDCVALLDCGTEIITKEAPIKYVEEALSSYADTRYHYILPLYGKVKCPYSKKLTTVTWTYLAASDLPNHFAACNGKHVPFAGSNYARLSGYIKNTWFPIYDEDIDAEIMDKLVDNKINYAKILTDGSICIGSQETRQQYTSDLSELNAVLILLDIKRDCERLISQYDYQFSESSDIARFNRDAEELLYSYADAQVRSITASFAKSDWEAARNILHLNVEIQNKDIVKIGIVEIDVV